ncbi:NADH dehydrogenase subunit E [Tepidamorphus gemmatus]|uniref:NADH dehydrogenase subunit E n=1 Tax=Tepidamorphus gemmatus TaxID=747076 RepID=A0A4V6NZQ6_9HYPH|nr:NADH-quinone oxidoreductase subunit NuoE [Tepidamorphus gemmatus]TCT11278.1 NADH dehydrogenase subunit E [Tepidamorphus gemmatus]
MAVRRLWHEQPADFAFTEANLAWARKMIGRYPEGRQASAVIPLLWKAQEQEGWVTEPAIRYVADMLSMPYIRVYEIATFYTMFQLQPVGRKAHVQVCGTTPCMLRGAGDLIAICKRRIAEHQHEVSPDGDFSWEEVECLGACVNAPMVQVFKDTYEDLTPESFEALLDSFASGNTPKPGPQNGRHYSAPLGGPIALTDPAIYGLAESKSHAASKAHGEAATREAPETPKARRQNAGRPRLSDRPEAEAARLPDGTQQPEAGAPVLDDSHKPEGLKAARDGKPDDLKRISGIGPKIEGILHSLGIFHYDQIAAWNEDNVAWIDGYLKFRGRIGREKWIEQARTLASGGETDFSKRYGKDD